MSLPAVLCLSLLSLGAAAQERFRIALPGGIGMAPVRRTTLRDDAARVVDFLIETYGRTDFDPLVQYLERTRDESPNAVVPFISLGHAHLNRFERAGDPADFLRALELFEIPIRDSVYPAWGERWGSSITLSHLMKGVLRLSRLTPKDGAVLSRVVSLSDRVERLAADEADAKMSDVVPYLPLVSTGTGDSKAEENAWEAVFLAWVSCLFPDHPRASQWEAKARLLASLAIVRACDQTFYRGEQVATVGNDFALGNHGLTPNPYYAAATLMLMRMGALAYRMTGHNVPFEFHSNVEGLYKAYRSYCVTSEGRLAWDHPSDPGGDPSLWPLPGLDDAAYTRSIVSQRLRENALWLPTNALDTLAPDPERGSAPDAVLWRAIQNAKVAWYYLDGAYLWLDVPVTSSAPAVP